MRNYGEGADVWTGHRDYDKENVDGNYTIINYPAPQTTQDTHRGEEET